MLVPKVFLPNVGFQLGIGTDFESTLGRVPRFVEVCWHCHCPACLICLVSCALNALSGPNPYISPGPTVHITLSKPVHSRELTVAGMGRSSNRSSFVAYSAMCRAEHSEFLFKHKEGTAFGT